MGHLLTRRKIYSIDIVTRLLINLEEESPSRLASQRNIIRVNHSALSQKSQKSQKKTKNIKINNLENGSVRNLSRNKNQK